MILPTFYQFSNSYCDFELGEIPPNIHMCSRVNDKFIWSYCLVTSKF